MSYLFPETHPKYNPSTVAWVFLNSWAIHGYPKNLRCAIWAAWMVNGSPFFWTPPVNHSEIAIEGKCWFRSLRHEPSKFKCLIYSPVIKRGNGSFPLWRVGKGILCATGWWFLPAWASHPGLGCWPEHLRISLSISLKYHAPILVVFSYPICDHS